jgi:hypothetical protein
MSAEIIRELDDYGARMPGGSACLAKIGDDYFVISSIPHGPESGEPETLAFAADADANVTSWTDVAGGRNKTREETIRELEDLGPDADSGGRGIFGDTKPMDDREPGEVLEGTLSAIETIANRFKGAS